MKGGSPQIQREGDALRTYYLGGRDPEFSGVATAYNLYRTMENIDVCIQFELLEVNVPITFLGTVGFSRHRDGR